MVVSTYPDTSRSSSVLLPLPFLYPSKATHLDLEPIKSSSCSVCMGVW
jgi:hypothetical protein